MGAGITKHYTGEKDEPVSLSPVQNRIFWISNIVVLIISMLDLTGWITGITWLKSAGPFWEPMKIISAICFLIASLSLIIIVTKQPASKIRKTVPPVAGLFLIAVGLLSLIMWIHVLTAGHETSVVNLPVMDLFLAPGARMSLFTAINFTLTGLILILINQGNNIASNIAHILSFPAAIIGYMVPVSYLLSINYFTQFLNVPVALNSGIAFCALYISVFFMRPSTWLMSVYTSKNSGGIMARRLLPWVLLLPILIGWFRIYGEHNDWFVSEIGVMLVALTYTTCFVLLVWFSARAVNRIDIKKHMADEALKKTNDELEIRVRERTTELSDLNKILNAEIKERIKAETLVIAERQRINGLLELMPAYIILLTADYHVSYANRTFRERFGESSGLPCYKFLFGRSEPCEVCETYKVLEDNKPHTWEWTGPDKRIYSIYDFPYKDTDGSPLIMEVGIDITNLKEAEANLVTLNTELEQRVLTRTAELLIVNERLDILSQTSGRLLESTNPQELINSLCTRVMNFLDCQVFFNFLIDDAKGKLQLNSYAGIPENTARNFELIDFGEAVCGCVARDGARIVAENIPETHDPRTELGKSFGIKAYACHPLLAHDKVIGTLSFGTKTRIKFSDDDLSMMKTVTDQVAFAMTRVRNEISLRRSEERYRSLMELSPLASFVNRNNSIVMLNSAARKLLGVTSVEDVLGKSPFIFFHNDYHTRIKARIEKILKGGTVPMTIEKIVRPDGAVRDVEVIAALINDTEGPAIQIIMNDITERKIAEKELFDTKNYLQNLLDYANAPIIVWDKENKIRLFNHAFEHLTGYSFKEVEGKKLDLLFPKDSYKDSMTKIRHALTENWVTIEIPILTKNNDIRTVLWNSSRIYDDNRKAISTIAQGNDITERIEADRALKESTEKLEIALENGNIGIWEWDISTDAFDLDVRMERMLGLAPGTFENTFEAFEKSIHEEDLPHVRNAIRQALDKNIPLDTIYRIKHKNNDINYISTKALVERDSNGNPKKMAGVCFDITEMKMGAEKALFMLNEELLRSNKELEQFAYVASHDLQEPLRMVSSFTQLLAARYKDKLDRDAQEFISFAVDGAARMQELINDLLDYSRIETRGKKFSKVDVNVILEQVLNNLRLIIQEKDARIRIDEVPVIVADDGQMVQLFQNLIVNGLKFCKHRAPRIHISVKEEEDRYVFSVKDNGIGIESQYFNRIFQIFQRLHPKDQYGGTGIGLAICKRIIDRHGGKIWVESKPGKGSVFHFTVIKR
ncbi:MAG: PAS domain S-box protein [Bacteroidales bacterium]|nr:PAS domain S-box protein [Bacteroidales bacterium]